MNFKLWFHRLTHWEYWSTPMIYLPLFPVWIFLSIKSRSLLFFHEANPGLPFGGMAMDSKKMIYDLIPKQHLPKTVFFHQNTNLNSILEKLESKKINFPLIAKPDIGLKGLGVESLRTPEDIKQYIAVHQHDFLIQEKINHRKELGIFYHRLPYQEKGKITGLVQKNFLSVIGDGKSTLAELIDQNPRSAFQKRTLNKRFANLWNTVISTNETVVLVPFGSHTRGAEFIDISDKISMKLEEQINIICTQIAGFHYGRLDVMFDDFTDLENGRNFKIIELNGSKSEPTHIYDPQHTLFFAWREITRHWKIMSKIAIENRRRGIKSLSLRKGISILVENYKIEKKLKRLLTFG